MGATMCCEARACSTRSVACV